MDCNNCILKVLKVQLDTFYYVLTTNTKGFVHFWDVSKYIENSELDSNFIPKYTHCLHQSGINCCDWLDLKNKYSLLTTGGDDQCIKLSIFHYEDNLASLCNDSITVHCSQVTGNDYFLEIFIYIFKNNHNYF